MEVGITIVSVLLIAEAAAEAGRSVIKIWKLRSQIMEIGSLVHTKSLAVVFEDEEVRFSSSFKVPPRSGKRMVLVFLGTDTVAEPLNAHKVFNELGWVNGVTKADIQKLLDLNKAAMLEWTAKALASNSSEQTWEQTQEYNSLEDERVRYERILGSLVE
jgi:hypothetical protein